MPDKSGRKKLYVKNLNTPTVLNASGDLSIQVN